MMKPRERGEKIDARRFGSWMSRFSAYRNPVTNQLIELWLAQFSKQNQDLAARVLDSVIFLSHQHIHTCYRDLLNTIDGWNLAATRRRGRWFFVPFSGSAGESGDSMVHQFRMATGLGKKQFNNMFIHRSDLVMAQPDQNDTVVLVDDFSGTGNQACESWHGVFAELLTGGPRIFLLLIAATKDAASRIASETPMELICGTTLSENDNIFHSNCGHFTNIEKDKLLSYCRRASTSRPKGYGDAGLVIVFAHQCPNNSIPILHANHDKWQGLFPRYS